MSGEGARPAIADASNACGSGAGHTRTRAWRANPRAPSVAEAAVRADGHLFLRPTHVTEHRRASQPCAAKKLTRRIKALRCVPPELVADDRRRAQHTSSSRARSGGEADATKCISQRTHLLVTSCVRPLGFCDGLASAHHAS